MTGSRRSGAGPMVRAARHLRPEQVVHRGRLRARRAVLARYGPSLAPRLARPVPPRWGWPARFVPLDATVGHPNASPESLAAGTFSLLNQPRSLADPPDWQQSGASQLWRYHLHYWEWAWALWAREDRLWARAAFARLWRSWKAANPVGRGDAWSPYVVSLRTWVLCALHQRLVAGSDFEGELVEEIALHGGFVAANLERDVGGNHLLKNLKALAGAGAFLADEAMLEVAQRGVADQLAVQVLADGGHYERSPSYHCQVLGDLLDLRRLLADSGRSEIAGLDEAIAAMRRWLAAVLLPDGQVPLLNDCTPVGADVVAVLDPPAPPAGPLTVLDASGYVIVRLGRWHAVLDVGAPCPPQLPAHAHADTLSLVLCLDGRPVVVDTGSSEYGHGPRRQYERSTAAHNTVEVDGVDSTEVFGAFRAGRRARPLLERAEATDSAVVVTASHDGFRHLRGRPRHRRTWTFGRDEVEISDSVSGRGTHTVVARLHGPGLAAVAAGDGLSVDVGGGRVTWGAPGHGDLGLVAAGFGALIPAGYVEATASGALPQHLTMRLRPPAPAVGGGDAVPYALGEHSGGLPTVDRNG